MHVQDGPLFSAEITSASEKDFVSAELYFLNLGIGWLFFVKFPK